MHIQDPVKHLRWTFLLFFGKIVHAFKPLNIFAKNCIVDIPLSYKYTSGIGTRILSIKPAKSLKISLSVTFFKNHVHGITIYSENSQHFQKNRLQDKFWAAVFFQKQIRTFRTSCSNILMLLIIQMNLVKRTITLEFNLNIEIWRVLYQ